MIDRIRKLPGGCESVPLIAHRGYTPEAPQNSLPAFIAAGTRGYWAIETDVHKTADGVLVCCHNTTVDATYRGSGAILEMTYKELAALSRREEGFTDRADCRIPTFREYLSACKRYDAVPFIETKTEDINDVLTEAAEFFDLSEIVISSSVFHHLELVRKVTWKPFVHHIFSSPDHVDRLAYWGYSGLSYNYPDLSLLPEHLVPDTQKKGVCVCLRAGDTPEQVRRMMEIGLDYIPTNRTTPQMIAEMEK